MDKETIKEFLKPDWRKALVFFIILIVPIPYHPYCPSAPYHEGIPTYPCKYIDWISTIHIIIHTSGVNIHPTPINFTILIIELVLVYFLSCLIIFTYDKFRGRK